MSKQELTRDNSNIDNPYKTVRIGIHEYMLNLVPFFTPHWFAKALINLFEHPCFFITQCGTYFSGRLFCRFFFENHSRFLPNIYAKLLLSKNITFIANFSHGFSGTFSNVMLNNVDDDSSVDDDIDNQQDVKNYKQTQQKIKDSN